MGVLRRLRDDVRYVLPPKCIVGRSNTCAVRVDDRHVSSHHARIVWNGDAWTIRDLGSKNGTFVEGAPLRPGAVARLERGFRFGLGSNEGCWELIDSAPPNSVIESIYERELSDDTVTCEPPPCLSQSFLRFGVSRNEERVEIVVVRAGSEARIEPREHGYLLLTLARARLADAALPPEQRGWRELATLIRDLRTTPSAINVAIHRARQQLAELGLCDASNIVEVRRRARRLGGIRFEIHKLG